LLEGAVDWVRVILREDARTTVVDHPGEPWAVSLEQTRLDNEGGEPAWIAGGIEDAQARYNLRNLSGPSGPVETEVAVLAQLLKWWAPATCLRAIGRRVDAACGLQMRMQERCCGNSRRHRPDHRISASDHAAAPVRDLLPVASPVNANTASAEVLAARFENLSLSDARRLISSRDRAWFRDMSDFSSRLEGMHLNGGIGQVVFATQYFQMRGIVEFRRVRLQSLVLLKREGGRVDVLWSREVPV
jgi:general secretion pathway protein K